MIRAPLLGLLLAGGGLFAAVAGWGAAPYPLRPGDLGSGARFGSAVAVGERVLAVGAYLDQGGRGSVHLYERAPGGGWQAMATPSLVGNPGEQFGYSVAVDGDTLIVGAPFAGAGGAAYRYDLAHLTREKVTILTGRPGAQLGCAVAAAGGAVAVGACREDGGAGTDAGRVYLLLSPGGDPPRELPGATGDRFGTAVALSPTGDTLVVGAPFHAGDGPAAGAAYVFESPSWIAKPLKAAPRAEDAFGYAVATDGDFIAVGAPLEDGPGQDAGAVYVYARSGDGWSQPLRVGATETQGSAGDQLGVAVALDERMILAGARRNGSVHHAGAAYRISAAGGNTIGAPLRAAPPQAGAELGFAVARHGPTDLVGAFLESNGTGAAYVFEPVLPTVQLGSLPALIRETEGPLTVHVTSLPAVSGIVALTWTDGGPTHSDSMPLQGGVADFTIPLDSTASDTRVLRINLQAPPGAALGSPASAEVTILPVGAIVTPSSIVTSESGQSATFTVRLTSPPASDDTVTVTVTSSNTNEGTVQPPSLTFTVENWNNPQTVTVTGQDDLVLDGSQHYEIDFAVTSGDLAYNGLRVAPVQAVNLDNDQVTGIERACSLGPGEILFTFVLTDHGGAQAEVDLTDTLPPDLLSVYAVSSDAGAAAFDPLTNTVSWRTPLSSGAPAALTLVAAVVPGTDGRIVSDQATFVYDADGDGVDETANTTDDPDSTAPHTANRATTFKINDTFHPLPPCPAPE
ncbi:MAG TPA: hypothetical protein VFE33_17700 [Thermoanaerobaculia bacterium]|nr:hypothetical protein [Thermoanaerobaculia bacterium]